MNAALEQPLQVGVALLASAEGYTPRATQLIEAARERIASITEVANALADNLPAPKAHPGRSRRRRRRKRAKQQAQAQAQAQAKAEGDQKQNGTVEALPTPPPEADTPPQAEPARAADG